MKSRPLPLIAIVGAIASPMMGMARADVSLPALFSDNMVLQRNAKVPIWGNGRARRACHGFHRRAARASTVGGPDGHWQVVFNNLPVADNDTLTVTGKNTLTVKNVAVGEVWLASGQSNMSFALGWAGDYNAAEIRAANDPDLRMFTVPWHGSLDPQADVQANWQVDNSQNVSGWSAVGYFFGRNLRKALGVPVGIIHSSYGGTPAEAWTSAAALEKDPTFRQTALDQIAAMQRFPADAQAFPGLMAQWLARNGATDTGNQGYANGWAKPDFDDSGWRAVTIPTSLGSLGLPGRRGGLVPQVGHVAGRGGRQRH